MEKLQIPILLGTNRNERQSGLVANWLFKSMQRRDDVVEAMVPVVRELGLAVTFTDLNFSNVQNQFDDQGNIKDPATYEKRAKAFLDEVVWMSTALRWGRANLKS